VLAVGPGDVVRIVLERQGDVPHVIYWNNPAPPARAEWSPRAGCLIETRLYPGQAIDSLDAWNKAWTAARPQGCRFVPNVFFGHNPLGPHENFLSRFTGYLKCEKAGRYQFATDSDDASFLSIDGRLIVAWPGGHGGAARAEYTGFADLAAGVHRIDYHHAQGQGGCLMSAAWRPPDAPNVHVIEPGAFVPVGRADVGAVETRTGELVPDFLPVNVDQAVLTPDADEYLIRMGFRNLLPEATLAEWSSRWSFGDGTTSDEPSPDHVYMLPGDYEVTLKLVKGYDERMTRMKVHVERDWDRDPKNIALREQFYDVIRAYDVSRMDPEHAWRVTYYFTRIAKRDDAVRAGKALLARGETDLDEKTLTRAVTLYAETMRELGKDYEGARKMLLDYEKRMKGVEHKAALALAAGDIDMWHRKDLEDAEACYRRVIFSYGERAEKQTLRRALVRMGDIYRWRHDAEKSREFLHRAQAIPVDERDPVQKSVRAGFLARTVEELLEKGDMELAYDTLVTWAWEFPADQLEGWWTEFRVRWLIRNKEYPGGIAEVESLLKLNPKSLYAPTLLWLAADCAEATGDRTKAVELLERILTDYPESHDKKKVVERIESLKKPPPARDE
jgi:tetratricopeptide (TPR) repeat protein